MVSNVGAFWVVFTMAVILHGLFFLFLLGVQLIFEVGRVRPESAKERGLLTDWFHRTLIQTGNFFRHCILPMALYLIATPFLILRIFHYSLLNILALILIGTTRVLLYLLAIQSDPASRSWGRFAAAFDRTIYSWLERDPYLLKLRFSNKVTFASWKAYFAWLRTNQDILLFRRRAIELFWKWW